MLVPWRVLQESQMAFKLFLEEFQTRSQKRDTGIPKIHSKSGEMDVVGSIGLPFRRP